jgi:hypothetical protein
MPKFLEFLGTGTYLPSIPKIAKSVQTSCFILSLAKFFSFVVHFYIMKKCFSFRPLNLLLSVFLDLGFALKQGKVKKCVLVPT